ncbi:MAG: hypothetical protein U1E60_09520 [Reyranellaceae bacterium]
MVTEPVDGVMHHRLRQRQSFLAQPVAGDSTLPPDDDTTAMPRRRCGGRGRAGRQMLLPGSCRRSFRQQHFLLAADDEECLDEPARLAVCDRAATTPATAVRPVLTISSGLSARQQAMADAGSGRDRQILDIDAEIALVSSSCTM